MRLIFHIATNTHSQDKYIHTRTYHTLSYLHTKLLNVSDFSSLFPRVWAVQFTHFILKTGRVFFFFVM